MNNHSIGSFTKGIFELNTNGLIISDVKGVCQDINQAALSLLGKTKDEMIGSDLNQIFYSSFDRAIAAKISKFFANSQEVTIQLKEVLVSVNEGNNYYLDITLNKCLDTYNLGYMLITLNDFTAHYHELTKLKKNQELLDNILNNSSDIIYVQDLDCRNLLVNRSYEEIFGVKKEDVIGKVGCTQPDHVMEEVIINDQMVINSSKPIIFEEEILHGTKYHTYSSTKFPLKDSNGITFGVGGISTDITEFKYVEKLNESLNHILSFIHTPNNFHSIMQKILDESSIAIGADSAGISILEDNVWIMRYGYGEIQNWVGSAFSYEELSLSVLAAETKTIIAIDDVLNDPRTHNSVIRKYGVKSSLIFPLITRGEVLGVLQYNYKNHKKFTRKEIDYINKLGASVSLALDNAFHRDNLEILVEARTKELRSSEERFAKAFNSIPNLMAITNLEDGRYIEVNAYFLNRLGYSLEEIIGKSAIELNILSSTDRDEIAKQVKEKGEVLNFECKIRTKDGQIREGLMTASIIEVNGEKCLLGVTKDITERNRLLREITRLDQLNLVGEMAAGIGHEIRNPMTTVRGFLQMLGTKPDCANYNEYFNIMIDELDRANYIITEFLSMAKDKAVSLSKNNLNNIVSAISSLISADALINDKRIKLELEDTPEILLDEKETRQLILNLSRNGLEAMEAGGTLTIKTFYEDGKVVLVVKDEGKGIEENILDKLGTPFFTTKDNGTGLGLAVCYSIAARHNAQIEIKTSSEGSTFCVYYPV